VAYERVKPTYYLDAWRKTHLRNLGFRHYTEKNSINLILKKGERDLDGVGRRLRKPSLWRQKKRWNYVKTDLTKISFKYDRRKEISQNQYRWLALCKRARIGEPTGYTHCAMLKDLLMP